MRSRSRFDEDDQDGRDGGRSRRGFASMDPERQREIASMGGRASHGGRGRDWEDEDDDGRGRSARSRSRYEEDDDGGRNGGRSRRGFASMEPERRREIASMGGRASHEYGTAHEWNSREAREAGRLGGRSR
jgi:general stress protein YciG